MTGFGARAKREGINEDFRIKMKPGGCAIQACKVVLVAFGSELLSLRSTPRFKVEKQKSREVGTRSAGSVQIDGEGDLIQLGEDHVRDQCHAECSNFICLHELFMNEFQLSLHTSNMGSAPSRSAQTHCGFTRMYL